MRKFTGKIKVIFREGENQITKESTNELIDKYTHMDEDGTIDLSMDDPTESKIMDIFLSQNNLVLNGKDYLVIKRIFSELEPAVYIQVKEVVSNL